MRLNVKPAWDSIEIIPNLYEISKIKQVWYALVCMFTDKPTCHLCKYLIFTSISLNIKYWKGISVTQIFLGETAHEESAKTFRRYS